MTWRDPHDPDVTADELLAIADTLPVCRPWVPTLSSVNLAEGLAVVLRNALAEINRLKAEGKAT